MNTTTSTQTTPTTNPEGHHGFHRPPVIIRGEQTRAFIAAMFTASLLLAALLIWEGTRANNAGAVTITPECGVTYQIQPGDTLGRIGAEAGQTVETLAYWNGIDNPDLIHTGDVMCVTEPNWVAGMRDVQFVTRDDDTVVVVDDYAEIVVPGNGGGDTQPDQQIRRAVWMAFGDLGLGVYTEALEIARCESQFDPAAHRTTSNPGRMLGDRGLFQMNHVHDGWLANSNGGIIERPTDLFDPYHNAAAARALFDRAGGWGDWFMSGHCHGHA